MLIIRLHSQMRAGTHYLLDALSHVYHGQIVRIKNGEFVFISHEENAKGLHHNAEKKERSTNKSLIFQSHYYHKIPDDERLKEEKVINLIGYPFDSFFSDGLIFSNKKYSVAPSIANKRIETYSLKFGTREWYFLEPYMHKNSSWLSELSSVTDQCIIRYEDFFNDFNGTCKKIEDLAGPFLENFPKPVKNESRMYWSGNVRSKMDQLAFEALYKIFSDPLRHFWPEKIPFEYK